MKVFTEAQNPAALTFSTPYGDRIYDIGVENPDGGVWYIETKSGDAVKDALQAKKDQ